MATENFSFQYCQKLVIFNPELDSVLLAQRAGEADHNGTYSFIGGKMETNDTSFIDGMRREKNEEIGAEAQVRVLPDETRNILFRKKDGKTMILPHVPGIYTGGDIVLNDEYTRFVWVLMDQLNGFEPKIDTVELAARWALGKLSVAAQTDFVKL